MRTLLSAAVAALSCGCGPAGKLDARFNGNWLGSLTVSVGIATQTTPKSIGLTTSGGSVTMGGDCGLQGSGDGNTFSLSPKDCPAPTDSCPEGVLAFEKGTGVLSESAGTLVLNFSGHARGCGTTELLGWAFSGSK